MDKNSILTGIIGLLLGCIIGFLFANNLNQSAPQTLPMTSTAASQNLNLPPNHPEINGNQPGSGPLPQVTEALKKAEEQPKDFQAQLDAGDLHYQIGKYDEAAKFYERANKIRPEELEVLVKTGNAHFDAERFEAAEKWYLLALAKDPDDPNVRTDLGLTFYLRKPPNIERAIKEYKTSLEKSPNHELSLQNLIVALKDKGDDKAAQEAIDKLAKINPNNPAITNK
jgi:tetratricopeptide (TPR) repeat protein